MNCMIPLMYLSWNDKAVEMYRLWHACVRGVSVGERQENGIGGGSRFYKDNDIVPFGTVIVNTRHEFVKIHRIL